MNYTYLWKNLQPLEWVYLESSKIERTKNLWIGCITWNPKKQTNHTLLKINYQRNKCFLLSVVIEKRIFQINTSYNNQLPIINWEKVWIYDNFIINF